MPYPQRHLEVAAELARKTKRSIDDLPYTADLEDLHREFVHQLQVDVPIRYVYLCSQSARKRGMVGARLRRKRANSCR